MKRPANFPIRSIGALASALLVCLAAASDVGASPLRASISAGDDGPELRLARMVVGDTTDHRVVFGWEGSAYRIDSIGGVEAGPGCVSAGAKQVRCSILPGELNLIRVDASGGDDLIDLRRAPVPRCASACGTDFAYIAIVGGKGSDEIRMSTRGINGNEERSLANAWGGIGDDLLVGSLASNYFDGDGGNDRLVGGEGRDTLNGDNGRDKLFGGGAWDQLDGGYGNDFIHSRDGGRDAITCGPGRPKRQRAIRDRHESHFPIPGYDTFKPFNC